MSTIWQAFHPQAEISAATPQMHQERTRANVSSSYKAYQMHWVRSSPDEEKRQCNRRGLRCKMTLLNHSTEDDTEAHPIPADCLNVSAGGLYGVVPIGHGVAMGQRYIFQLAIPERGPEPGTEQIITQQGTIVRTELLINPNGKGNRVGIGVQLFGQRSGVIPMPDHP